MNRKLYCQYCGKLITEQSEEYQQEYPIASLEAYERLVREHWENDLCESEEICFDGKTGDYVGRISVPNNL